MSFTQVIEPTDRKTDRPTDGRTRCSYRTDQKAIEKNGRWKRLKITKDEEKLKKQKRYRKKLNKQKTNEKTYCTPLLRPTRVEFISHVVVDVLALILS